MQRIIFVGVLAFVLTAMFTARPFAAEQNYPTREIALVVPFAPGGPTDTATRIVQPRMSAHLGVPIVVVNKPGAGGALGADGVASAKPDGYTVLATFYSTLTTTPAVQRDIRYRLEDFTAVGSFIVDVVVVAARAGAPWKTYDALVATAKSNPGKLTYGSAGVGTDSFFTMEIAKLSSGIDIAHVPFAGSGPVKAALLGGHVNLGALGFGTAAPLIRSGDLIPLLVTAPTRMATLPEVPTMAEKGMAQTALAYGAGLFVPAKTPRGVVERLAKALSMTMKDPEVVAAVEKIGMIVQHRGPEETLKVLQSERTVVANLVKRLRIGH